MSYSEFNDLFNQYSLIITILLVNMCNNMCKGLPLHLAIIFNYNNIRDFIENERRCHILESLLHTERQELKRVKKRFVKIAHENGFYPYSFWDNTFYILAFIIDTNPDAPNHNYGNCHNYIQFVWHAVNHRTEKWQLEYRTDNAPKIGEYLRKHHLYSKFRIQLLKLIGYIKGVSVSTEQAEEMVKRPACNIFQLSTDVNKNPNYMICFQSLNPQIQPFKYHNLTHPKKKFLLNYLLKMSNIQDIKHRSPEVACGISELDVLANNITADGKIFWNYYLSLELPLNYINELLIYDFNQNCDKIKVYDIDNYHMYKIKPLLDYNDKIHTAWNQLMLNMKRNQDLVVK